MNGGIALASLGVCGPPQGFYLIDRRTAQELAYSPESMTLDTALSLLPTAGQTDLSLVYVNEFGTSSTPTNLTVASNSNDLHAAIARLQRGRARPVADGYVQLYLEQSRIEGQQIPTAYSITDRNSNYEHTFARAGRFAINETIGPFANGQRLDLMVVGTDGVHSDVASEILPIASVVADASAPDAPAIFPPGPNPCD